MNLFKKICILFILINSVNLLANPKFKVDGDILHYNTELAVDEYNQEINWDDAEYFLKVLKENPTVKTLYLTSWGGQIDAAIEMADIIIDYELNTHVKEICFSACPLLLIGGEIRTLEKGSKIGFHRSYWDSEDMKIYYEDKELQEYYGWKNEFDFSSWVFDDSQEDIYQQFKYYLERGVSPDFVIETMKARSEDGWYPRRKELLKAKVISK
jgi:hypothetical protein